MREITVLSGKGGTGKTTITAALASVAKGAVFCDNDVDAADLHLLLKPEIKEKHLFLHGWNLKIDVDKCTACGLCVDQCRFDAIHTDREQNYFINQLQCEGCRLCEKVCTESAISSTLNTNNNWYISDTRFGTMVHAKLSPGEENSGKLVTQVRKVAKEKAVEIRADFILNDGPPGIGCSTISSLTGADLALIVIEPTKSGYHDALRLMGLIRSFGIKAYAIINKCDVNPEMTMIIRNDLSKTGIELIAEVPFNQDVVKAMINEKTIVEYDPKSEISTIIKKIWERVSGDLIEM
ncbi:4Fe-4S binding protein [Saccharicrinis sp. FJH62]|uniref:ATP-binding protein n=1 Tax=Saccharicrinis sp. FJH62 TaxID=3344657 RepID=UPI0035D40EB9